MFLAVYHTIKHRRSQRLGARPNHSPSRTVLAACPDLCLATMHYIMFVLVTVYTRTLGDGDMEYEYDQDDAAGRIMLGTWTSVFVSVNA